MFNKRVIFTTQYYSIGIELDYSKSNQEAINEFSLILRYASKISIVIHVIVLVLKLLWFESMNKKRRRNHYYYIYSQLLYRIYKSYSLVFKSSLSSAIFILFTSFIRYRFVFYSLICTLILSIVFIINRITSKAYLSVLICVLVVDLILLALLRWQLIRFRSKSELFRRSQTWILILKCVLNSALISLIIINISREIDDDKSRSFRISRMLSRLINSFRRTI